MISLGEIIKLARETKSQLSYFNYRLSQLR